MAMTLVEQTSAEALSDHLPGCILASSQGPAWTDLLAEIRTAPEFQETFFVPAVAEPQLVWCLKGNQVLEEREIGGQWLRSEVQADDLFLTASATPYEVRWHTRDRQPVLLMTVYLGLPLLLEATRDLHGEHAPIPDLHEFSATPDPTLRALLELLRQELLAGPNASQLLVQSLARSLALHLVRRYGKPGKPRARRRPGLTAFQLAQLEQYILERLDRAVPLSELSEQVSLSQFHFSRLFKQSTGVSPSRYLTRLRLARARRLLRETERSVLEIGLEVGYASASHFSEVFAREVGATPSDYRRNL